MTRHTRHITTALLALCLLLTACGGKQTGGSPGRLSGTAAYTSDIAPLDLPLTELTASAAGSGDLYLAGLEEAAPDEAEDGDGEITSSGSFSFSSTVSDDGGFTFSTGMGTAALYRLDADTGELMKLSGYAPEEGVSVAAIVPCEDGSLWVLERVSGGMEGMTLDDLGSGLMAAGGGISWASQVWRKLDAAGEQELDRIDVTNLAEKLGVEAVTDTRMDPSGQLYAASGSTVTVLDASLSTLFTCRGQETVERLVSLSGGVGAVAGDENGRTVYPVDLESQGLGPARPLSGSADRIYDGNEKYDFFYSSGDSLYGWSAENAAPEKVLSWSGAGVDKGQVETLALLPDGRGTAALREGGWPASYSWASLAPAGEEELAGRTVLTLATMGLSSETRARVLEFNRTSSQYRIEIQDYSEYNTSADASAGLSKLNTEILAGNMPDLLDVSGGIPLRRYAARGLLADLWPYIESDPELGRDKVMERPLEAASMDGKLYQVFQRFALETAAGAPAAVGDKMGWSLEELRAALAKLPAGGSVLGPDLTKDSVFETMFSNSLDSFVDWEACAARFDSPEFQEILEFCASLPAQASGEDMDEYTRVASGAQLLLPVYLNDLQSIQLYRALFGGGVTFAGYPSEGGSGVSFSADNGMAMSASCKDAEGAWSFLRQVLLPIGEQPAPGLDFPVNRADFEQAAEKSMEFSYLKDETGNTVIGPDGEPMLEGTAYVFVGGQGVMLKPATQADYDQIMALYEAADSLVSRDENIWAIVREQAGACFAGDRTAEEAARAIQSRVELYLNEQK